VRAAGDILLISTYELGHQPLHLASPLAFFAQAGFHPRAIDLAVDALDEKAVRSARWVGIAVPMHTALRLGVAVGDRVKQLNRAAHLCYYGLYAPLNADYLRQRGADSIVGGEYEVALVEQVVALERSTPPVGRATQLERLPFVVPARASLPAHSRYAHLLVDEVAAGATHSRTARTAGYVEASRGCLHACRHCPIPPVYEGRFFVVPAEIVLADVAQQVAAGVAHVTLGDPDFFNGPRHALAVARAIHAAHPTLTFDVTIKVEHILRHRHHFSELRQLGCVFVVSAIESLSDEVLRLLDKGHTRADVDAALAILDEAELPLRPTWVPFTPWTTMRDYLDILDWIESRGLVAAVDPIQLAIRLLVPPGSKLLALPEMHSVLAPLVAEKLSYEWRHPDPRMDRLAHDVFAAVEKGADFATVRALAEAAAGAPVRLAGPLAPHRRVRGRAPKLSESWFC
jgi:radical SAM superfamily enzyme YgiQ (UPF0313 family)